MVSNIYCGTVSLFHVLSFVSSALVGLVGDLPAREERCNGFPFSSIQMHLYFARSTDVRLEDEAIGC